MSDPKHANALSGETSPYLLQHAHNPVQWNPWGDAALRRAKEEDKPILLSIGYSACHWCHVMEHESFENEAIAAAMNEDFINIKVDREERPDLDSIYMNFVQMTTGRGGWPLTVFLTPDQVPFFGGTYFPPEDRHGMPGFPRILLSVALAYRENGEKIRHDAHRMAREVEAATRMGGERRAELTPELLDSIAPRLIADYDSEHGGFGSAPKFPPSMTLSYLMRAYRRSGTKRLLEVVEHTLRRMAAGGIYDQLGGGFHRYSVDQYWLVPHFEKMLYDNALLSRAYLDAFLLTGDSLYRRIAEETLDYVLREMTSPEGGFYSSQDADSEGEEGKFYTWSRAEVTELLGPEKAELFCRYYDVTEQGNFEGAGILNVPRPAELVARLNGIDEASLAELLSGGRRVLFREREKRVRPGRDDKVLAAWNGLMMRSFAEAASALDRSDYLDAARRNALLVLDSMRRDGRLLRSYKDGRARFNAYLEDHSCMIDGLLSLYEAAFELRFLTVAEELAATMIERFYDSQGGGGFFFTSDDHEALIARPKDIYDNAVPSGTSVAVHALLRLWKLTGDEKWMRPAVATLEGMAEPMGRHPGAFSHLACALDRLLSDGREIAVAGDPDDDFTRRMLRTVFGRYLPNKVVACGLNGEPFLLRNRPLINGRPTAYVCEGSVCKA
ncbi:MAG: thioredoxin domain-containing protein, partial [Acidobacteriota bacterium]